MKIIPIFDRVLVKRLAADTKSFGGILLAGSMTKEPTRGKVLAVGPGTMLKNGKLRPLEIKVGDVVVFTKTFQLKIEMIDNEEYILMKEKFIVATIEE